MEIKYILSIFDVILRIIFRRRKMDRAAWTLTVARVFVGIAFSTYKIRFPIKNEDQIYWNY